MITYCFDGVDHTNALKEYTNKKFNFLSKFGILDASVVFSQDKRDCVASVKFGSKYAHQRADDFYKSIDLLADKVFSKLSDDKGNKD